MENIISKTSLTFIKELKDNNNREWFNANKQKHDTAKNNIAAFADWLIQQLNRSDKLETASGKKAMFRIYRDVRFSKNKEPYKTHWSAAFTRASAARRGSYYFQIEPENKTVVGGGFYEPNPADLKLIRSQIAQEPERLKAILEDKKFKSVYSELLGEQVKTAPKGFSKDHPAIDLLRYKHFYVFKTFTDEEVLAADFAEKTLKTLLAIRPFFDYMSEILTTNLNGESLID
jgi:uncharacterized protein (TIGR02453 family)